MGGRGYTKRAVGVGGPGLAGRVHAASRESGRPGVAGAKAPARVDYSSTLRGEINDKIEERDITNYIH